MTKKTNWPAFKYKTFPGDEQVMFCCD